jgi:glycine/D-amino acid oxidase-like deaminating enzyme
MNFDFAIVGGGIIGWACALRLARSGQRGVVIDRAGTGQGTTSRAMGHLVALDGDDDELAFCRMGRDLWRELLDGRAPEAEYNPCGTLWLAQHDTDALAIGASVDRFLRHGVRATWLDTNQLYRAEPQLRAGLAGAIHVPDDGVLYPPWAAEFLGRSARQLGVSFFDHDQVIEIRDDALLLKSGTRISAQHLIVAAGLQTATLLPGAPIFGRKGQLVITDRGAEMVRHQLVELGYTHSAKGDADVSIAFNLQPRPHGQMLLGSSRSFTDTGERIDTVLLRHMIDRAISFVPALAYRHALRSWTGFRPMTPDHRPLIGPVPGHERVWVASGHEGLGITTALSTAALLGDLIENKEAWPCAKLYDPARFHDLWQGRRAC